MSFITTFMRNLLHPNHPGLLVLFVTDRCNCKCAMCFNAANVFSAHHAPDLPLTAIEKIARSLQPLPQLLLSGGEPFMRSDVPEIVNTFYDKAGTRQFSIPTNGTLPRRIATDCEAMMTTHPDIVLNLNLSLDNVDEAHDTARGLTGCYERVRETFELLNPLRTAHAGFSVNMTTIITEETAPAANAIIDEIRSRFSPNYHAVGILRSNHTAPVSDALIRLLAGKMDIDVLEQDSFNGLPLLNRIVPALGTLIKKRYLNSLREDCRCFTCLAGKKIIVITADGRLMPCEPLWLEADIRKHDDEDHYLMARLAEHDFDVRRALASARAKSVKSYVAEGKCWCSYVCAIQNGILYSPRAYPLILVEMLRR